MKVIINAIDEQEISKRGIRSWPIWEKEVSEFDWFYDSMEQCLFLEGEVIIKTNEGDFMLRKGNFVTFEKGLSCKWKILKPVKKHYKFS
jgi:hypothetical protein